MPENDSTDLGFKRRVAVSWRMLRQAWLLRKSSLFIFFGGAVLETGGSIAAIYAGAKLSALLARFASSGSTAGIWFWFWITLLTGLVAGLGFLTMAYAKRELYFTFVRWSVNSFLLTLTQIDLPQFYDDVTRNQINKVGSSYTWQLSNLSESNLDLIYGILRFIAITAVVSQITWWIVPLIGLFLIPTLLSDAKIAKLQWFV